MGQTDLFSDQFGLRAFANSGRTKKNNIGNHATPI
jgi:hypothetical protein